jgi:hypothetical protein
MAPIAGLAQNGPGFARNGLGVKPAFNLSPVLYRAAEPLSLNKNED